MKFRVDKKIFDKWPGVKLGVIVALDIDNNLGHQESLDLLRSEEKKKLSEFEGKNWQTETFVTIWRDAYKMFGASSKKYSSSIEALLKRVVDGKNLPDINSLVNFYNYLSIKYLLPFGGEDLDKISGEIELVFAEGKEKGIYLGSEKEETALPDEVIYKDNMGFICRRWNWREAKRTAFSPETKNAILVAELLPPLNHDCLATALNEFNTFLKDKLKANTFVFVVDKDNPEIKVDFEVGQKISQSNTQKPVEINLIKSEQKLKTINIKNKNNQTYTEKTIVELIARAIKSKSEIKLEHPADSKFGDYSTNIALSLAKDEKKNPREVAEKIKGEILRQAQDDKTNAQNDKTIIDKIEVAGPGFINFYLTKNYLKEKAEEINFEIEFKNKLATYGSGKTMVIDYSAPNIAKPFGIGHLRSTNIGQALYNLYKTLGWKCIGDNHLGDWGTQFGKLMVAIKKWGDKPVEKMAIADLEKLYVKFHHEAEKDESLVDQGREWFARLENGNAEAKAIWQKCIDISIQEFNRVYELLDVHIDFTLGESFYTDKMGPVVKILEKKKILKDSQGAKIVEFEKLPPAIVTKTNETTTYFTRDLATLKYRLDTWKPELIIYEVGADQNLYFRQLFAAAEMLGWMPAEGLVHIGHGLIRWKTGKFSTRKGDTIHLEDVIDKAMAKSKEIADKTAITKGLTAGEKEAMIKEVAIGAIKFNDLKSDPKKDIIFDWEQMMNLEGDSGPYVQYTHARICSVLEKTTIKEQKDIDEVPEKLTTQEEKLLKLGYQFEGKIVEAAANFNPAILAEYLLTVARTYNEFYATNKIIGDKAEVWRIFLTKTTQSILHQGLVILGIKPLEKM